MPAVITQTICLVDTRQLTPHPANPRKGDLAALQASIQANGFYGALVVQRSTGYILAGNHRYQAAQALGISELPVTYLEVDDATALRILLVDNRSNDKAGYADQQLVTLLQDLQATGAHPSAADASGDPLSALTGSGYTPLALNDLLQTLKARDQSPPDRPANDRATGDDDTEDDVWTPLRIPLAPAMYARYQQLIGLAAQAGWQKPYQQFDALLQAVSTTTLERLLRELGVATPHAD